MQSEERGVMRLANEKMEDEKREDGREEKKKRGREGERMRGKKRKEEEVGVGV